MPAGAATLTISTFSITVQGAVNKVGGLGTSIQNPIIRNLAWNVVNSGVGADQCDVAFADVRTLVNGTSETLALTAGASSGTHITNGLGDTLTFGHLKAILVANLSTVQGDYLLVGGSATNPVLFGQDVVTSKIKLDAGGNSNSLGVYLSAQTRVGYPVGLNASDLLKVDASLASAPVNYLIILLGTST